MKNDSSTNISSSARIDILQQLNEENFTKLIPTAFILTMLAVLGTLGNSLSIYIFTIRMRRNVQNDLFKLLCVVNVLACAVCIPGDIINLRYQYLYPSEVACKLMKFLNMYTMAVSVFTLETLAIYRLRAASPAKMVNSTLARIANPRRNNIAFGIAAILVISACMCWIGIVVFGMRTNTTSIAGVNGQECSVADEVQNTAWPFVYNAMLVIGFTTLITITIYAYYKIWRTVKKSRMAIVAHSMVAASPSRTAFKNLNNGAPSAVRGTAKDVIPDGTGLNRVQGDPECSNSSAFSSPDKTNQASNGKRSPAIISLQTRTASKMSIARYTEVIGTLTAPIIDPSENFSSAMTKSSDLNAKNQEQTVPYLPSPKPSSYSVLPLNVEDLESSSDPPEESVPDDQWISNKQTPSNAPHLHEAVSYLGNGYCNTQSNFSKKPRDSPTNPSLCVSSPNRTNQNSNCVHTSMVRSELDKDQKHANNNSVESGTIQDEPIRKHKNAFSAGNKIDNDLNINSPFKEIHHEITRQHSSSVSVRSSKCETTKNITEQSPPRENSAPVLTDASNIAPFTQFSSKSNAQGVYDSAQTIRKVKTPEHPTTDIFCVQTGENDKTQTVIENSTSRKGKEPNFGAETTGHVHNTNKQTSTVSLESTVSEVYINKLLNKNNPLQPASGQAQNSKQYNTSSTKPQNLPEQTKQTAKGRVTKTKTTLEAAVSRTAFLLTFTFIISYLPYFFVSIPRAISPDVDFHLDTARINLINLSSRLFYISPSINPIIFWASNLDFRRHCKCLCSKESLASVA